MKLNISVVSIDSITYFDFLLGLLTFCSVTVKCTSGNLCAFSRSMASFLSFLHWRFCPHPQRSVFLQGQLALCGCLHFADVYGTFRFTVHGQKQCYSLRAIMAVHKTCSGQSIVPVNAHILY